MKEKIKEMEAYAQEYNIPILEKETAIFLMNFIKKNNYKSILEIGSAIGYSTILLASANEKTTVTTIERDEARYMECLKNVKAVGMDHHINVVYQDALEVNLSSDLKFDFIFIDAAKGQYIKFFEKFKYFLNPGGVIVTDNIGFHGYVGHSDDLENGNLKSLVKKIEGYVDFLQNNAEFDTEFIEIGDGISISRKKDEK